MKLELRELYCPSHFGNTYEMAGRNEMIETLSGAKYWGFSANCDSFNTVDLYNV